MWTTVCRPGYLGKHRNEKFAQWDQTYGKGKWRLVWKWGPRFLSFGGVCLIYEQAYFLYLKSYPNILSMLIATASDVYDDAVTNINSGLNYRIQETDRTHIQDISIRRVLKRLKTDFKGDKLIQIRHDRGDQPLSMLLSPGVVKFHKTRRILQPELKGWWYPNTVESFYQSNRVLQKKV